MKIFGVIESPWTFEIEVQSVEVIKETAKRYWLEKSVTWYNYRKSIEKDSPRLHLTAEDALNAYLEHKQKQIENIERKLSVRLAQRDNAKELLTRLTGK